MSQRNPMNDRYQAEDKKGQTRKSAATAKPKKKAASTVRIESTTKTPKEKRAAARASRQQKAELDRKYYAPPTAEYKKWRRIWVVFMVIAIAMTASSFGLSYLFPEDRTPGFIVLGLGYAGLIGALVIDQTKIKKIRRAYQAEMQARDTKEARAEAKKEHAAAVAAKKAAAEKEKAAGKGEGAETSEAPAKKGLLSFLIPKTPAQQASPEKKNAKAVKDDAEKEAKSGVSSIGSAGSIGSIGSIGKKATLKEDEKELSAEALEEATKELKAETGKKAKS